MEIPTFEILGAITSNFVILVKTLSVKLWSVCTAESCIDFATDDFVVTGLFYFHCAGGLRRRTM